MNSQNGFKLVPVETLKFALGLTSHGFKNRTDQEADKYAALKTITELLEAPALPQPIYDDARERELFAEFSRRIVAHDAANFPIRWCDCVPDEEVEEHLNTWLACAQSRAKYLEVGHE